jgi:SAM-dependent methyltransferase
VLRRWAATVSAFGLNRQCPVCGSLLRQFRPHGAPPEPEAVCPVCGSKAPHRLAMVYFLTHCELFRRGGLLLHVAPERELGRRLRSWALSNGMSYKSGGISGTGEHFLDLRQLPLPDSSVDLVYCCHVLNSMQEDRVAMREVHRVLRPTGVALLQAPAYHTGPTTLETSSLEERLAVFHDEGIARCYTDADYVDRLQQSGFVVERFRATDRSAEEVERHQLKQEVLHVCRRA